MTCSSCATRIGRQLQSLEGVDGAEVNYATGVATISYDPGRVGVDGFRETVE